MHYLNDYMKDIRKVYYDHTFGKDELKTRRERRTQSVSNEEEKATIG